MKKILFLLTSFFFFSMSVSAISGISVSKNSLVPIFDNNIKVYNVYVSSDVEIVTINVNKSEEEVVTGIGSVSLKPGLNVFEILSYIDNNLIDKYTINITRGDVKNDVGSSYLTSLSISGAIIEFNKNVYEYVVNTIDIDNLNIDYITENPSAYVKVSKEIINDKEDNIFINVTSQDNKNTTTYKVKIIKDIKVNKTNEKKSIFDNKEFSSFELKLIIIGLITLGIIVIGIFFYLIFIRKYKSFTPFKKE